MRKYALLMDNVVVQTSDLDEQQVADMAYQYQLLLDIEDQFPQPQIGWVLEGNKLISQAPALSQESYEIELASKKTTHGILLSREAVDKIGARNKILNKTGTQVSTLLNQLVGVKMLLETGALGTARYSCTQLKAVYPEYTDIFTMVVNSINEFEQQYGL